MTHEPSDRNANDPATERRLFLTHALRRAVLLATGGTAHALDASANGWHGLAYSPGREEGPGAEDERRVEAPDRREESAPESPADRYARFMTRGGRVDPI